MNTESTRKINRRMEMRRKQERRDIPHPYDGDALFGEDKSDQSIQPKKDRRVRHRRTLERRQAERRYLRYSPSGVRLHAEHSGEQLAQLLTQEERKMLDDLSAWAS